MWNKNVWMWSEGERVREWYELYDNGIDTIDKKYQTVRRKL